MSNRRGVDQDGTGRLVTTVLAADFVGVPCWKRALDISCVLIVIPLLLPLILITAIIIKAGSKGPLLFRQERIGLLGKRFVLLKFRTLKPGSDTAVHEAHVASLMETNGPMTKLDAHGDARLIPFGRLLRAAGLDELPQLINVLRGEMSLVGPRPCLPGEYDRYLLWQRERFRALPGLTGLWQVSGKNRTTFNEMIDFDIRYVRMQSAWLDLKIMLKTIPVVMDEVKNIRLSAISCGAQNGVLHVERQADASIRGRPNEAQAASKQPDLSAPLPSTEARAPQGRLALLTAPPPA